MRSRIILVVVLVVVTGVTVLAADTGTPLRTGVVGSAASPSPGLVDGGSASAVGTSASPSPPSPPTLAAPADPDTIRVSKAQVFGWALLDRHTGQVAGSTNKATMTNTVESMVKPWIVADYLRRLAESGRQPTAAVLRELTLVVVDSNDPLAEEYYRRGGSDAVIRRLVSICGLTDVTIKPSLWSWTRMSPQDMVRYGACLGDGLAAGPQWTSWLLGTMTEVRGTVADQVGGEVQGGRWGIIDGLPAELARDTSIKNGWTSYVDGWHVNCLAVHPDWTLGIMMRTRAGLAAAADGCRSVAAGLVVPTP